MAKDTKAERSVTPRGWVLSTVVAVVVVGLSIALSATVNPMFGRSIHWDWMAGVAPVSFAVMLVAVRRRWV